MELWGTPPIDRGEGLVTRDCILFWRADDDGYTFLGFDHFYWNNE